MDYTPGKLSEIEASSHKSSTRYAVSGKHVVRPVRPGQQQSSRSSQVVSKNLSPVDISKMKDVKVRMVRAGTYLVPGKGIVKTPEKKHKTILNSMRKSPVKKAMEEKQEKNELKNKDTNLKDTPTKLSPKKQKKAPDPDSEKCKRLPDIVVTPAKKDSKSPRKNSASKKNEKTENVEETSKSSQKVRKSRLSSPKVSSRSPSQSPSPSRRKKNSSPDKNTRSLNVETTKPVRQTRSPSTKNAGKMDSKGSVKKSPSKSPKTKTSPRSGSSSKSSSSKKNSISDDSVTLSSSDLSSSGSKSATPGTHSSPGDKSSAVKKLFNSDDKISDMEQPVFEGLENCSITVDDRSLGILKNYNYKYSLSSDSKSANTLSDLIAKVNNNIETPNHECNEMFGKVESLEMSDEMLSPERVGEITEFNDSMDSDKTVTEFEVQGEGLSTIPEEVVNETSQMETLHEVDKTVNHDESLPSVQDDTQKKDVESEKSDSTTVVENLSEVKEASEEIEIDPDKDGVKQNSDSEMLTKEVSSEMSAKVSIFEHFGLKLKRKSNLDDKESSEEACEVKKEDNVKDGEQSGKETDKKDVIVIPDTNDDEVLVISDEDSVKNSPEKKRKIPCVNHVVEPKPIQILTNVERQTRDKRVAFQSDELEEYIDVNKENMGPLYRTVEEKSESSPSIKTSPTSKEYTCSPDLDEVNGFMFVSFSSEDALKAHLELENKVEWLTECTLKKLAQLKIMKERQLDSGKRRVTDVKSVDEQKQNFRGLHMKYSKYQKLLKQEYDFLNLSADMGSMKTPEKTSDITKIKGWKNKFKSAQELQEAARVNLMESGKLHWRTEDRLLRNLNSDDMKDIGLDLKRKRRKMINYSNKKKGVSGKHSIKKSKENIDLEHLVDEDAITEADVYNEDEDKPPPDKIPYSEKYLSQHKYGQRKMFVKKMNLDSMDERILKKLGTQKINDKESAAKFTRGKATSSLNKITQIMAMAAVSAFDRKLFNRAKKLDECIQACRAIHGAQVPLLYDSQEKDLEKTLWKMKLLVNFRQKQLAEEIKDEPDGADELVEENTGYNTDDNYEADQQEEEEEEEDPKQTDRQHVPNRDRRDKERKKSLEHCDQPGCRYGCICHLCKLSDSSEEKESEKKPPCDKEYCKLGCICDSIDTKQIKESSGHCRKPACMFECKCPPKQPKPDIPKSRGRKKKKVRGPPFKKKSTEESDLPEVTGNMAMKEETVEDIEKEEDWEPPPSKKKKRSGSGNSRFANLPKRESTYRLAKNLDAVSRKAMIVYESSEMYAQQRIRRRRSDPLGDPMGDYFFEDPFGDFVGTGYLPPAVSGKDKPKTNQKQAPKELPSKLNPATGVLEISDESDDNNTEDPGTCARSTKYTGNYNVNRYKKKKPSEDSTHPNTAPPSEINSSSSKQSGKGEVIELPDSDDDNQTKKAVSQLTVSQRLGLARKKESQMDASKWKTQMVCLKAKKKADDKSSNPQSEIKLLEIISNCNWESDRTNMLSKISHIISKDYTENFITMWQSYVLQFLPKADKPAVIPPELQSKLPNSMYSIRVRVTQNITDIEKAENEVKEAAEKEEMSEENMMNMSEEERKKFCIKQQGKLIEKIKFAERLRDLIKNEEGKGISSKFSVSLEGIEKALKRYKTQLYRAYTGTSSKSLTQIKQAIQALKKDTPTSSNTHQVTSNEGLMMPSGCGVSTGTLSRLQSNQGLKIQNSVTLSSGNKSFISLESLQPNNSCSSNITIKNQGNSAPLTAILPKPLPSGSALIAKPLPSGPALIAKPLSTSGSALIAKPINASGPIAQDQFQTGLSVSTSTPVLNSSGKEVFLIPVQDNNAGKWDPKSNPVFSAKVTMVATDSSSTSLKNSIVNLTPVPSTMPLRVVASPRCPTTTKLMKPMLNPALTAYANAPVLPGHYRSKQPGGVNPQILLSSLQQITSGSPIMSQVQTVMSHRMTMKPQTSAPRTVTPVAVTRPQVPNTSQVPVVGNVVRPLKAGSFNAFPPIRYATPYLNSSSGQVNLANLSTTNSNGKQMILLPVSTAAGSSSAGGQAMIAVPVSSITAVLPPSSKPIRMVTPIVTKVKPEIELLKTPSPLTLENHENVPKTDLTDTQNNSASDKARPLNSPDIDKDTKSLEVTLVKPATVVPNVSVNENTSVVNIHDNESKERLNLDENISDKADTNKTELKSKSEETISQEQSDTNDTKSKSQEAVCSEISDFVGVEDTDNVCRKRKGTEIDDNEPPSKLSKQECSIIKEVPSKTSLPKNSDESEGSDIDIMSVDDIADLSRVQSLSRRKSHHMMSLARDDFQIKQMRISKHDKVAKLVDYSNPKIYLSRSRCSVLKRYKDELSKVTFKYNAEIRQLSSAIPQQFVLSEAKKLITALEEKEARLTESMADGTQYQLSLKNKLQSQIDSFVSVGVPEQVIQNFLKGIYKATSSSYPKQKRILGSNFGEMEDCDADLDYKQLSTSDVLKSKNTVLEKVLEAIGDYPSEESQHSEDHSNFVLKKLESLDSGVYVDHAEHEDTEFASNSGNIEKVVDVDSGSEDEIRSSTGDVLMDNDVVEDEGGGNQDEETEREKEFEPTLKIEPVDNIVPI